MNHKHYVTKDRPHQTTMLRTFCWLCLWHLGTSLASSADGGNATVYGSPRSSAKMDSDYYKLEDTLLKGYRPHLRPVYSHSTAINMSLSLIIYALHEVSERYQTVRHFIWLNLRWKDEFLVWNPDHFNGISFMEIPGEKIWTPNLVFSNSVSETRLSNLFAAVAPGGILDWGPVGMQETMCTMDITYYPFDVQRCIIFIDMWTSREKDVNLSCISALKDPNYMENPEWELSDDLTLDHKITVYEGDRYTSCQVSLVIKRRRLFHCLTLILPNGLLALLASYVFVLPVQCGEKLSFSVSLMLAFAVNLSVLISTMPRSSLNVSYLMIYLTCLSIVTALSIITTVCLQKLYHQNNTVHPKVRTFILFLASLFNFPHAKRHGKLKGKTSEGLRRSKEDSGNIVYIHSGMMMSNVDVNEDLPLKNCSGIHSACGRKDQRREDGDAAGFGTSADDQMDNVSVSQPTAWARGTLRWKDAVVILDHVCFRVFFCVIVAMTLLLTVTLFIGQ